MTAPIKTLNDSACKALLIGAWKQCLDRGEILAAALRGAQDEAKNTRRNFKKKNKYGRQIEFLGSPNLDYSQRKVIAPQNLSLFIDIGFNYFTHKSQIITIFQREYINKFCTSHLYPLWACLDVRNHSEVRKWGSIIAHFPIYPNTGKGK